MDVTQIIILVSSLMLPGLGGTGIVDGDPATADLLQVLKRCDASWDTSQAIANPDERGTSFLRIAVKAENSETCAELLNNTDGVRAAYIKPEEALP